MDGEHVFRTGLNFRFYRHVDQRGQPGGINVTPSVTFSQTTRPPFLGTTGNSGFRVAPNINSTDQTLLGNLINNLYGLPASMTQLFISNLQDDAFLPFKVGDQVTLYAEKHVKVYGDILLSFLLLAVLINEIRIFSYYYSSARPIIQLLLTGQSLRIQKESWTKAESPEGESTPQLCRAGPDCIGARQLSVGLSKLPRPR